MSADSNPQPARTRRSRSSIAHMPMGNSGLDLEDGTVHGVTAAISSIKSAGKKSRSKSLGPGGLEALREAAGNRQKVLQNVKSILKPSIPLSPPKQIPPHSNSRKTSPARQANPALPSGVSQQPFRTDDAHQHVIVDVRDIFNNFAVNTAEGNDSQQQTRVSLRSEEEQHAAARTKEKQEAIERRDARRKSLANRRVSFAPEATLHTWDVIELAEDVTTSSEATNSTRRASSGSTLTSSIFSQDQTHAQSLDTVEAASTLSGGEIQVAASPVDQQKNRRRSSGIPPMNFNNPDDFSSSPASSITSDDANQCAISAEGDIVDASDSDDDKDSIINDETLTTIDADDTKIHTITSVKSSGSSSTGSSGRLDAALLQAAERAGTQGIEYDEYGESGLGTNVPEPLDSADQMNKADPESVGSLSPAFRALSEPKTLEEYQEMTMDMTLAFGNIISTPVASLQKGRRKSAASPRRRSGLRRRSSGASSSAVDETMELTTVLGGIEDLHGLQRTSTTRSVEDDEDMSMEFTAVVGRVLAQRQAEGAGDESDLAHQQLLGDQNRRISFSSAMDEDEMEVTMAAGRILSPVTERTEPTEESMVPMDMTAALGDILREDAASPTGQDMTMAMDITAAFGDILPEELKTTDKHTAKLLMEEEADHGQLTRSPFRQQSLDIVSSSNTPGITNKASETGSPRLVASHGRSTRRSVGSRLSNTPRANPRQTTPVKKPMTPSKQLTPKPERPATPSKTPPAKNVAMRRTSPVKLFKAGIKKAAASDSKTSTLVFSEDATTGSMIPSVILTPRPRRPSGVGINQTGLGSPRAAALLDRRSSIGQQAETFTPQAAILPNVRFEDPRVLEHEIDHDRAEEYRRESGRGILQMEADMHAEDEKDATANLRDMILSLTPKKNKLKGRKSLAIGAAKDLLGKRPAELDDDDDDDDNATPKRLRGKERSPVKNIRLPAPPSKTETTGRLRNVPRFSLGAVSGNVSTPTTDSFPMETASTPKGQNRFKDAGLISQMAEPPVSFNEQLAGAPVDIPAPAEEDERIRLQDFLNMTSIRFMELNTTKRRHTMVPDKAPDDNTGSGLQGALDGRSLESCVVAGACTVPMLELYQHSCRELKKYISEGRSIVREIETDTFEDNPPLFREYISATSEVRSIMDNQFKNVKTQARLLSKAMWYEWRMKLLDGLRDGLLRIGEGLVEDADLLGRQERLLHSVVPALAEEHARLESEARVLQAQADELAGCDQDELNDARDKLMVVEGEVKEQRRLVEELQGQLREHEQAIEKAARRKQTCLDDTEQAEKVREACKGWSGAEVAALKANVDALEKRHGWTIAAASGASLTLTYRGALSLFLAPSSFLPASSNPSPIGLTYVGEPEPSTQERFFLQLLRARLQGLAQAETPLGRVLDLVGTGWEHVRRLSSELAGLDLGHPTEVAIASDELLAVTASLLLRPMRTRVEVRFELAVGGDGTEVALAVAVAARVVYGEDLKEARMREFLAQRIAGGDGDGAEGGAGGVRGWTAAVRELETRLLARGKKGERS